MSLIALTLTAATMAQAAAPAMLAPRGTWELGDTPGMCLVTRGYASGGGEIALGLRLRLDGRYADLSLGGADGATGGKDWTGPVGLTMFPSGRHFDAAAQGAVLANGMSTVRIAMTEETAALLDQSTGVAIDTGHAPARTFALDQQFEAETLLHRCQGALLRSWGVDYTRFIPIGRIKAGYMPASTYPAAAVAARQEGRVSALIEVAPNGHVSHCRVLESSHSESLDNATCDIATNKARFTPLLDGAGKATNFWSVLSMRWVLPTTPPPAASDHATPN